MVSVPVLIVMGKYSYSTICLASGKVSSQNFRRILWQTQKILARRLPPLSQKFENKNSRARNIVLRNSPDLPVCKTADSLRAVINEWRDAGSKIALVPTMGNLHTGHLKLVDVAKSTADKVVVSIFVNPTQFCAGEDFNGYPRTMPGDLQKLQDIKTDLVFAPKISDVDPNMNRTTVELPALAQELCGQFRSGHFTGVTTIVCKLLNMVQPDLAVFGEKDFQQLTMIRMMVGDLNIPVEITGVDTVRETDGLAMSSRNFYLSEFERTNAAKLYQSLCSAKKTIITGNMDFRTIENEQLECLRDTGFKPDYFSIRRIVDLMPATQTDKNLVILVAAYLGKARLIDNVKLKIS